MFKKHLIVLVIGTILLLSGFALDAYNISDYTMATYRINSYDGTKIVFDVLRARDTPDDANLVILLHGFSMNRGSMRLLGYALAYRGFISVLVDLRGHGDSEGSLRSQNFTEVIDVLAKDVRAVIDYLKKSGVGNPYNISVIGHSMGGEIAIYLGYKYDDILISVGISPALAKNFVNMTKPKHLIIVGSYSDRVVTKDMVIETFKASINDTVEIGRIYNYGDAVRELYFDEDSTHLTIIYDKDVLNLVSTRLFQIIYMPYDHIAEFEPIKFLIPPTLIMIGIVIIVIAFTPLLSMAWRMKISREEIFPMYGGDLIKLVIESVIITGVLGGLFGVLILLILSTFLPLLSTNFIIGLLLGNAISLTLISKKYIARYREQPISLRNHLMGIFLKNVDGDSIRLYLLYTSILVLLIQVTFGSYLISIVSSNILRIILIPLYLIIYVIIFSQDESFFRYVIRKGLGYGLRNSTISLLINVIVKITSLVIQIIFISVITGISMFFLLSSLILVIPLIILSIIFSESLFEHMSRWFPQILINATIFAIYTTTISPII